MKQLVLLALLLACRGTYADRCELAPLLQLPVSMLDSRTVATGTINGAEARFTVDSGAFYSIISRAAAVQFKLHLELAPADYALLAGVGGSSQAWVAKVKDFGLGGQVVHNIEFLVSGNDPGLGRAGVVGQNVLGIGDAEYDLGKGLISLFRPRGCSNADLAYWAGSTPHSVISIEATDARNVHTWGQAYVNDKPIRVMFDTGSTSSVLTKQAAERLGVTPDSPGVTEAGFVMGSGQHPTRSWIATFPSFRIGTEEIRNARLRIIDSELLGGDMVLGVDFFLSHRIYIARSQRKLYFTYSGGPVFNLKAAETPAGADEPVDADTYARRGAAFGARRDYTHALADLTRACELAPNEPTYLIARAETYLRLQQSGPARTDVDRALQIKPDYLQALLLRSELRFDSDDKVGAAADIDAAERLAPKASASRMQIAHMYESLDRLRDALQQWELWIPYHQEDINLSVALNARCRVRALIPQDLDRALADCNRAVRLRPDSTHYLETRALVKLRRGEFKESLADCDAAHKLNPDTHPNSNWAHYIRGLDLLKLARTADGQAEIEAARKLTPDIAEVFAKYGIRQ